jgi:hypothetical protein
MTLAKRHQPHRRSCERRVRGAPAAAPARRRSHPSAPSRPARTAPQAPRPRAECAYPRGLGSLPPCTAPAVALVRPSPRLATLRPTPIRQTRLPPRPRTCRRGTHRRAVPLLRTARLEPQLAALEQALPSPWLPPRSTTPRLRPGPLWSIVRRAHGRLCSRRAKSREGVPPLSRGDCRCGRAVTPPTLHDQPDAAPWPTPRRHPHIAAWPHSAPRLWTSPAPPPAPWPEFDEAAAEAVRQWKYDPATLEGTPVPFCVTVTVNIHFR